MASNYLEALIAEWLEYRGMFVRTNVHVGPRAAGGYEAELDVVALDIENKRILHYEPSMDGSSWAKRETRYRKKFDAGKRHIPDLFENFMKVHPDWIEQYAVLGFGSDANHPNLGGGRVVTAKKLFEQITADLADKKIENAAVPENAPRLRTIQFMLNYFDVTPR